MELSILVHEDHLHNDRSGLVERSRILFLQNIVSLLFHLHFRFGSTILLPSSIPRITISSFRHHFQSAGKAAHLRVWLLLVAHNEKF